MQRDVSSRTRLLSERAIEGDPPRVAQAIGVNFGAGPFTVDERVVGRNGVRLAIFLAVDIDPQDRAEQRAEVLAVAEHIVAAAAIPQGDVQVAVGVNEPPTVPCFLGSEKAGCPDVVF